MLSLLFTIAQSVLVILQAKTGNTSAGVNIANELVKIAQAASAAHKEQTGKPIDPSLIKPIEPIP